MVIFYVVHLAILPLLFALPLPGRSFFLTKGVLSLSSLLDLFFTRGLSAGFTIQKAAAPVSGCGGLPIAYQVLPNTGKRLPKH